MLHIVPGALAMYPLGFWSDYLADMHSSRTRPECDYSHSCLAILFVAALFKVLLT